MSDFPQTPTPFGLGKEAIVLSNEKMENLFKQDHKP